jgi:putative membrane protein
MIDILFCMAGIALGLILGLIPGLHINNFMPAFALLSLTNPQTFFLVIGMSMSFVFSSSFPSILLGVPNEDTALNILPGHRLVLEGEAYSAIIVSLLSGFLVVIFTAPFLLLFLKFLPLFYPAIQELVPYLLIALLFFMFISDKKRAIIVIIISSALGLLTISYNLLLPLLTGFFGMSTLIFSLSNRTEVPPQVMRFKPKNSLASLSMVSFMSCFLSSIFGFIPAISSSIVSIIGSYIRKLDSEEFLALTSGTNVAYMSYSFFALLLIQKTRSGSAVLLSQIFEQESIFFVLGIILLSSAIAFLACMRLAKSIVRLYSRLNYRKLCLFSISFMVMINFVFAGFFGLLVLATATSIGLLANLLGTRRTSCMACLIVPTIAVLL